MDTDDAAGDPDGNGMQWLFDALWLSEKELLKKNCFQANDPYALLPRPIYEGTASFEERG